ncbi:unnamed protein product, partial [Prorocentrum cordatum]
VVKMIRAAKKFFSLLDMPKPVKSRLLGKFEMRCVMFVHKKSVKGSKSWGSIEEIGAQFLMDVYREHPNAKSVEAPWPATHVTMEATAGADPQNCSGLRNLGDGSIDTSFINSMGFKVGVQVASNVGENNGQLYTISEMTEDTATLRAGGGKKAKPIQISLHQLADDYTVKKQDEFVTVS